MIVNYYFVTTNNLLAIMLQDVGNIVPKATRKIKDFRKYNLKVAYSFIANNGELLCRVSYELITSTL